MASRHRMSYAAEMASAIREREGPPRPSELPAEYRSGSFFSEAQAPGPATVIPRRSGLGLRTTLTLWLLGIGLCPVLLVLFLSFYLRQQDQQEEALRAAVLLRETVSPDLRDNACEVQKGRLWALRRASGYQVGLYNLHRPVASTFEAPPTLPWDIVRRTLEGDRAPQLFRLRHQGTSYLAAAVKLSAPAECGSPVLLVLLPRWAVDPHVRWTLLGGALGLLLLLLPPVLLLPRRLGSLLGRLHRRVQLIHRQPRDPALSGPGSGSPTVPLQFPPPIVQDEPSRLLDPALLSRPDEIGDLSRSFAQIMDAMRDNEARLGARVRELTTLHAIGRAISSVLDLEEALNKIVSEVVGVFTARRGALVLVSTDMRYYLGAGVRIDPSAAEAVAALGEVLIRRGGRVRIDSLSKDPELAAAARHGGLSGSLLCAPLDQQGKILGVLMITRTRGKPGFNDADLQLLSTVADQASTAISNARLYDEVQRSSEELELRVKERTVDLLMANEELARVVENLHQAQAQLVLSERLAGLGQLVAGVAHEINSPAAAIRGAADALQDNVARMTERARQLADLPLSSADRARFLLLCAEVVPHLPAGQLPAPAQVRRLGREFAADLFARPGDRLRSINPTGPEPGTDELLDACRTLAELGVADHAVMATLAGLAGVGEGLSSTLCVLVGYLEERTYLYRNAHAIRTAIGQISRIVGALKSYSHLDQARIELTDIHEGLETTLVILHSELKYGILLTRKYGTVPSIHAYVDELNQVWTNLLHNAVQALQSMSEHNRGAGALREHNRGAGALADPAAVRKEIVIETGYDPVPLGPSSVSPSGRSPGAEGEVWVAIEDSGPGIPSEILPRIFEPFFTTKDKGEGTGLGLGIVRQIVTKHGGRIDVSSVPGRTRFTVRLPVQGPAAKGYR